MASTISELKEGDRIAMSWAEYSALGDDVRGGDGTYVESGRHRAGTRAKLDVGVAGVVLDPAELL